MEGAHLTKGHYAQSSTKCGHKMSLHRGAGGGDGIGGTSDHRSA